MTSRLLLLLLPLLAETTPAYNTDCDVGHNALTEQFSTPVPQTCIDVMGQKRCYYTYIPHCATELSPVVYDIHGYGECPRSFSAYSGWFQKATEECFIVVWPIGKMDAGVTDSSCWSVPGGLKLGPEQDDETASCCCQSNAEPVLVPPDGSDDMHFLRLIAFYIARDIPMVTEGRVEVDPKRLYFSGHANGCLLAHAMAAFHSDLVAAVACMSGMPITALPTSYEPVPTWTLSGALDEIMPTGGLRLSDNRIMFPGAQEGFQYLSQAHGCSDVYNNSTIVQEMDLPEYPLQGTLHVQTAFGCVAGAIVQHFTLVTAGHLPYNGVKELYPENAADTTVDTTGMAWAFLSSFESKTAPVLEQEIDLHEIEDMLETSESQEATVPESTVTSQAGEIMDLVEDFHNSSEYVDTFDLETSWQGLRGAPGISEEEALSL